MRHKDRENKIRTKKIIIQQKRVCDCIKAFFVTAKFF